MRSRTVVAALAALLSLLALAGPARAADPAWRTAEQVRDRLFDAQQALILDGPREAAKAADAAADAYAGALRDGIAQADPAADRTVRSELAAARRAAADGDAPVLAAARGAIRAALLRGSATVTLRAVRAGDADTAREWLLLREFRTATRFTRAGADGTLAVEQLDTGKLSPAKAEQAVRKDLLDAYQGRLRELLADAARNAQRGFRAPWAEAAAQADGSWRILAGRYREDRGEAATQTADRAFAALRRAASAGDATAAATAQRRVAAALDGFTAAPFTAQESARRAQQLLRFVALIPVEYRRGTKDDEVTKDFEIQEAVAFQAGAVAAFADLQDQLTRRGRAQTLRAKADLETLGTMVDRAATTTRGVPTADEVEDVEDRIDDGLRAIMPDAWTEPTDESDYDLIALTLDRMEAAVGAGQYRQAEQARLEAYAFFEFGPERRLKSFDQGLALTVEGLIWFGADGKDGLATLIADRAPRRQIRETRVQLDKRLGDAAATLGDSANRATVVTNAAIIVFREGLEGVLILAAITASFVGVRRRNRRPVFVGALLGLLVSLITWVLAQTLLRSLDQYGEKLEAVVGLIAIGVLLLITNWFFHRVYWSEWIGKFHRQRKKIETMDKVGFFSAQVLGLGLLGLTSVYREGFETVLFLQSLQLSAGTAAVVEGAGLGLALTFLVAVVTFALQRKLPYKKMLIVTGVMIGFVLVVMVGQTARTMQGTGWLPITPLDVDMPYWSGLWFGVYPTWETVGAQVIAAVFVIGSYYLAREVKVKRPVRKAVKRGDLRAEDAKAAEADPEIGAGGLPAEPAAVGDR
ncbi:FTR1 family iron permease [Paraconexibacter algicola]|uniref:Iron permease n=1 Tax=Paraconexibacter algicola TaxID=2133960 RepID=A0A2T4UMQ9_9ACTN|nr:FTR1 family protein [Paraconexibacter algicola]PTL60504.1 iron permease [Paraconexibacter algicola]